MWCHLCKIKFSDHDAFKCHILEIHRPEYEFYKDTDSEDSEQENLVVPVSLDDSDLEIYEGEEESAASAEEDAIQLSSSDEREEESPSKSNSPVPAEEPSPNDAPHAQDQSADGLRRSSRLKRETYRSKMHHSVGGSDAEKGQKTQNSESTVAKQVYVINPVGSVPQSMYVINTPLSNTGSIFVLNSQNILEWLSELRVLSKDLKYPLPPHLYKKVKRIHKELLSRYCMASPSEENNAILKVYEDLDSMILQHISCINKEL